MGIKIGEVPGKTKMGKGKEGFSEPKDLNKNEPQASSLCKVRHNALHLRGSYIRKLRSTGGT